MLMSELYEKQVKSSWNNDVTYNRTKKIAYFSAKQRDGSVKKYAIYDISRRQVENWWNAASKGQFFHQRIKDKYNIARIE